MLQVLSCMPRECSDIWAVLFHDHAVRRAFALVDASIASVQLSSLPLAMEKVADACAAERPAGIAWVYDVAQGNQASPKLGSDVPPLHSDSRLMASSVVSAEQAHRLGKSFASTLQSVVEQVALLSSSLPQANIATDSASSLDRTAELTAYFEQKRSLIASRAQNGVYNALSAVSKLLYSHLQALESEISIKRMEVDPCVRFAPHFAFARPSANASEIVRRQPRPSANRSCCRSSRRCVSHGLRLCVGCTHAPQ